MLLAGSRAAGTHSANSDWDIFLYGGRQQRSGFYEWKGALLDLTFKEPLKRDAVLTIPYGPLIRTRILLDESKGTLEAALIRTERMYTKGPLKSYRAGCGERLQKLERWVVKLHKHIAQPEIQYYYQGVFYELVLRVWFEQRNLWPLPPVEALPYIQNKDSIFYRQLGSFRKASGTACTGLARKMIQRIQAAKFKK